MFSINGGGGQDFSKMEALGSLGRHDSKGVLGRRAVFSIKDSRALERLYLIMLFRGCRVLQDKGSGALDLEFMSC